MKLYKYVFFSTLIFGLGQKTIVGLGGSDKDIKELKEFAKKEDLNISERDDELAFTNLEKKLLKGDYKDIRLKLDEKNDVPNEILKEAVQNYKIHLMPHDDFLSIAQKLVQALKKDSDLQKLIYQFKFLRVENLKKKTYKNISIRKEKGHELLIKNGVVAPLVVIYPSSGKDNAQKALDKIYEIFKDTTGINVTPRYNERINDLIFVAQGNSTEKEHPVFKDLFEPTNKVYFDSSLISILRLEKIETFKLVNPAEKLESSQEMQKTIKEVEKEVQKRLAQEQTLSSSATSAESSSSSSRYLKVEEEEEEEVEVENQTPPLSPKHDETIRKNLEEKLESKERPATTASAEHKQKIFVRIKAVLKRHPWVALLGGAALLRLAVWMYQKISQETASTMTP